MRGIVDCGSQNKCIQQEEQHEEQCQGYLVRVSGSAFAREIATKGLGVTAS